MNWTRRWRSCKDPISLWAIASPKYEDRDADLEDDENSRSSRERRRYTDQIEHLEQQLEDLRLEYEVAKTELQRLQRQQGEVKQRVRTHSNAER